MQHYYMTFIFFPIKCYFAFHFVLGSEVDVLVINIICISPLTRGKERNGNGLYLWSSLRRWIGKKNVVNQKRFRDLT